MVPGPSGKDEITKAAQIAKRAAELVSGDRAQQNGDMFRTHSNIAAMWNTILIAAGKEPARLIDAHDVANMMEGMKIVRRYGGRFNIDDYIDGAGYASCAGEIAAMKE